MPSLGIISQSQKFSLFSFFLGGLVSCQENHASGSAVHYSRSQLLEIAHERAVQIPSDPHAPSVGEPPPHYTSAFDEEERGNNLSCLTNQNS
jgi:hypothetical protein